MGERVREASHPSYSWSPLRPTSRGCGAPPRPPIRGQSGPRASGVRSRAGTFQIQLADILLRGDTSEHGVCGGQKRVSLENVCSPVCQRIPPVLSDTREKGHKQGGKRPGTFPKLCRSAQGGLEAWGGEKGPPSRGSRSEGGATTS